MKSKEAAGGPRLNPSLRPATGDADGNHGSEDVVPDPPIGHEPRIRKQGLARLSQLSVFVRC